MSGPARNGRVFHYLLGSGTLLQERNVLHSRSLSGCSWHRIGASGRFGVSQARQILHRSKLDGAPNVDGDETLDDRRSHLRRPNSDRDHGRRGPHRRRPVSGRLLQGNHGRRHLLRHRPVRVRADRILDGLVLSDPRPGLETAPGLDGRLFDQRHHQRRSGHVEHCKLRHE